MSGRTETCANWTELRKMPVVPISIPRELLCRGNILIKGLSWVTFLLKGATLLNEETAPLLFTPHQNVTI